MLINVTGGSDLTLHEVAEAVQSITDAVDPDANIIAGLVVDDGMVDEVKVTVIATGSKVAEGEVEASGTIRAGAARGPCPGHEPTGSGAGFRD